MTDLAELVIKARADVDHANRELKKLKGRVSDVEREMSGFEKSAAKMSSSIQTVVRGAVAVLGPAALGKVVAQSIRDFADFEEGLIGIGKTADLTGVALQAMGDRVAMISHDLPVATTELLAIGQAAGQLGVKGSDNIARFTETVGKLQIASDLAGEEAATSLARILTVSKTAIADVDRLGSTIVQMGNNFAATEAEIAGVATRVSQGVALFDVSAANIVGISTALKAIGVEAQVGGTQVGLAFLKIEEALQGAGEEAQLLSGLMGQSIDDLRKAFAEDSTAVFQQFIEALGQVKEQGGSVATVLGGIGLSGSQAVSVLGTLSSSSEVLAKALMMANEEWERNTALSKEAQTASKAFNAQLQIFKNLMFDLSRQVGAEFVPDLEAINAWLRELIQSGQVTEVIRDIKTAISEVVQFVDNNKESLVFLASVLGGFAVGGPVGAMAGASIGGAAAFNMAAGNPLLDRVEKISDLGYAAMDSRRDILNREMDILSSQPGGRNSSQFSLMRRELEMLEEEMRDFAERDMANVRESFEQNILAPMREVHDATDQTAEGFDKTGDAADDASGSLGNLGGEATQLEKDIKSLTRALEDEEKILRAMEAANRGEITQQDARVLEERINLMRDIEGLNEKEAQHFAERVVALEQARASAEDFRDIQAQIAEEQAILANAPFMDFAENFEQAYTNFVEGFFDHGIDALGDFMDEIKNSFKRLGLDLVKQKIFDPIFGGFVNSIRGAVGIGPSPTINMGGVSSFGGLGSLGGTFGVPGSAPSNVSLPGFGGIPTGGSIVIDESGAFGGTGGFGLPGFGNPFNLGSIYGPAGLFNFSGIGNSIFGGKVLGGVSNLGYGVANGLEFLGVNAGTATNIGGAVIDGFNAATSPAGIAGGLAGGFAANAVFGGGTGTSVGSAVGGLAGPGIAALAAGGPIGWGLAAFSAFLGAFGGGGIGSLFNNRDWAFAKANIDLTSGGFSLGKVSTLDGTDPSAIRDATENIVSGLNDFVESLGGEFSAGRGGVRGTNAVGSFGTVEQGRPGALRGDFFGGLDPSGTATANLGSGAQINGIKDAGEAAAMSAMEALREGINRGMVVGLPETVEFILLNTKKSLEDVSQDLEAIFNFEALIDRIMGVEEAKSAVQSLVDELEQARNDAWRAISASMDDEGRWKELAQDVTDQWWGAFKQVRRTFIDDIDLALGQGTTSGQLEQLIEAQRQRNKDARTLLLTETEMQKVYKLNRQELQGFIESALASNTSVKDLRQEFNQLKRTLEEAGRSTQFLDRQFNRAIADLADSFNSEISKLLIQTADPLKAQLIEIVQVQQNRLAQAKEIGANVTAVQRLNALELQRFFESLSNEQRAHLLDLSDDFESLVRTTDFVLSELLTSLDDFLGGVDQYRSDLVEQGRQLDAATAGLFQAQQEIAERFSGAQPIEQLTALRDRFSELAVSAQEGDVTAMSTLPQVAIQLLDTSRNMFASGAQFQNDLANVTETLGLVGTTAQNQRQAIEDELAALDKQVDILLEIRNILQSPDPQLDDLALLRDQITLDNREIITLLDDYLARVIEQQETVRAISVVDMSDLANAVLNGINVNLQDAFNVEEFSILFEDQTSRIEQGLSRVETAVADLTDEMESNNAQNALNTGVAA